MESSDIMTSPDKKSLVYLEEVAMIDWLDFAKANKCKEICDLNKALIDKDNVSATLLIQDSVEDQPFSEDSDGG